MIKRLWLSHNIIFHNYVTKGNKEVELTTIAHPINGKVAG